MLSKKVSIITFSVLFIFLLVPFASARELEVPLPSIGEEATITETPILPDYVKYIFNFSVGIAGFIAFLVITYGGVRYILSRGNPASMADANNQIFSGLIGLVVILASWMILTTINPQLVIISPALPESGLVEEDTPGVYLCKNADGTDCQVFTKSTADLGALSNRVQYVKFKPFTKCNEECEPEDCDKPECREVVDRYGVVLHEGKNYRGRCEVCLEEGTVCEDGCEYSKLGSIASIHVFRRAEGEPHGGVKLYACTDYDLKCTIWGPFQEELPYKNHNGDLGKEAKSIDISPTGNYLVALFKGEGATDRCEVFTESDPNLSNNYIGVCGKLSNYGCAYSIIVIPIK